MSTKWQIHRRTFLRGIGAAVALPMLDAMAPSLASVVSAAGASPQKSPRRMAFVYVPNGVTVPEWTPKAVGANFDLPRILQPLAALKENVSVLSGFDQKNGMAMGDGAGDHARACASFLTGAHPRKTSGRDIRAGISVDQLAARHVGQHTVLPSLELSCDAGPRLGACDSGYSCTYQFNISWRDEAMPMMPEVNPQQAFERLFGDVKGGIDSQQARSRRAMFHKSILDFVRDDAQQLQTRLGGSDRRKIDEYLTAVREIEKRVELAVKTSPRLPSGLQAPEMHENFEQHIRLMFDMLVLAFQTDSTRVATFMLSHEGSNRSYGFLGVNEGHHEVSHHGGRAAHIEKITKINTFHMTQFAYFLEKLKSIREGDGTLLDNSMIMYGSGIRDGDRHEHEDLPLLLAGGGGGTITQGRHIKAPEHTPLNNLLVSLLERAGAPVDRFGDSTGRFEAIG
jgi:hypothetical protein